MENKQCKLPPIVWLKVTDFMHGWLQHELGGTLRIKDQRVVSMQHLPGARNILRFMETELEDEDGKSVVNKPIGMSMSAVKKNCAEAGLSLNDGTYKITRDELKLFAPIECPKRCVNQNGTVRPWTERVNLGKCQASELLNLLRNEFWKDVGEFSVKYAAQHEGEKYPQLEMIEAFCAETDTPIMYAETIRREWQRRVKREGQRLRT